MAAAERLHGRTAYARVDVVERTDGAAALLELELLDPVLFFVTHPEGARRFATVLHDRAGPRLSAGGWSSAGRRPGRRCYSAPPASGAGAASGVSAGAGVASTVAPSSPVAASGTTTGVPISSAKSAQAAWASVSGVNSPSA